MEKALLTAVSILLALVVAETTARFLLSEPQSQLRPFHPFFVSGDSFIVKSRKDILSVAGGPKSHGYSDSTGTYIYTPQKPASVFDRSNFLFEHSLSRYGSHRVDEISLSKPDSIRIFVIGGSAAQGTGSSDKGKTWHAILESKLREALDYHDIYIFNAAMGSFVTTQERIAYDMAVVPRNPDLTIVLDGFNDMYLPPIYGTMPGDPYQTGLRYHQIYNTSAAEFLRRYSALASYFHKRAAYTKISENIGKTMSDKAIAATMGEGIENVYTGNIEYLLGRGSEESPILVFFQPWNDYARIKNSRRPRSRYFGFYLDVSKRIKEKLKHNPRFIDLSSSLNSPEGMNSFIDYVHFNDTGQKIVADAIFPHLLREVERIYSRKTATPPSR